METVKKILRAPLFRITSLNGISVLVKIAIGFVTSKVIAVFVGPSGMALAGNLRNFLTSAEGIATLGFQNGIVKYIAETRNRETEFRQVLSTVFLGLAAMALVSSAVLFCCSGYWSRWVFAGNASFASVFRIMAVALPFYAASIAMVSVINGLGLFRKVIYTNVIGNVIGLAVSVVLIYNYRTLGALLAIVIAPAFLFFVTLFYTSRELDLFRAISARAFNFGILRKLASYSLMALVSAICVPLAYLAIRQKAIVVSGIDAAGHWEAMNRISSYSLLFATTLVSIYFLPKLVLAEGNSQLRGVFANYFKGILPFFAAASVVVYVLREFIVRLLFTPDFLPVQELFGWQLLGDFFKVASLILGYCFFAKRLTLAFIVSEMLSLSVLYASSIFFLGVAGIKGLAVAHFITYLSYFLMLGFYFRKALFAKT